ncbi:MAG: hypothetical protein KAV00_17410 [Phycisphaerae bacterium]|nr:hypothetical protein [Phycisphaerae bacterium]
MTQQQLRDYLDRFIESLDQLDQEFLEARLRGLVSVFPFNEYEYILIFLRDRSALTFDDYEKLRNDYVSSNRYLELYGLAPRIFGQIWGEQHLRDLDPRFKKADNSLDPHYEGQYDLWIEGVRVEVKSARGIDTKKRGNLVSKALRSDSQRPFWMNFQQLKLDICDVFVFMGVWVDQIAYWVLSNDQIKKNRYLSHQHRGGVEYQIGVTDKNIDDFDKYCVTPTEIADVVIEMGKNNT